MITVSYDDSNGVIRTVTYGPTSREEIEAYLLRLREAFGRARMEWGRVFHLVDASLLELQTDENLKSLAGASVDMEPGDEDKTAVIMTAAAAIDQLDHMPSQLGTMVFSNYSAAKAWLFAESGDFDQLAA